MNTLYYGDNLHIRQEPTKNESIDLIYLDPPFNSKRVYNVYLKTPKGHSSEAQVTAFEDSWTWGEQAEQEYNELLHQPNTDVAEMIASIRKFLNESDVMAYLVMMSNRLLELHRVLKPTGSLYLHCDPTASHYLKIVLDAIFGADGFRNEVIWKRTTAHNDPTRWGRVHDTLFFYSKSDKPTWNDVFTPYGDEYKERFRFTDPDGRKWTDDNLTAKGLSGGGYTYDYKGSTSLWRVPPETMKRLDSEGRLHFTKNGGIRLKRYLDELPGLQIQDVVTDIFPINSQATERLGYPTQKPLALLERIIQASSNPGDIVLDPFCGCGTAVAAAEKLGRRWIGIDITHPAISLMQARLRDSFGINVQIEGSPTEVEGARKLAQQLPNGREQFELWALTLVGAMPQGGVQKKGAGKGVDGIVTFTGADGKPETCIVSVKSGGVGAAMIDQLRGAMEAHRAAMGLFVTLEEPTGPMKAGAAAAGYYHSAVSGKDYPRVQTLSIRELLEEGRKPQLPLLILPTYQRAERIRAKAADQAELFALRAAESPEPFDSDR